MFDHPAAYFVDLLWRWFVVQFLVYYIMRNVLGHALQMVREIGK